MEQAGFHEFGRQAQDPHDSKPFIVNDSKYHGDAHSTGLNLDTANQRAKWNDDLPTTDASGSCHLQNYTDDSLASHLKPAFLRLPELVDLLAKEGKVLRWDVASGWYEVLDGPLFEEKFNALRCTRGKRKEQAADRPFARYTFVTQDE